MVHRKLSLSLVVFLLALPVFGQQQSTPKQKPRVIVVGVNGMELDIIRPLLLKGQMPNLSKVIEKGAYGKLRTVSAPNCPRVYSTLFTSTDPEEHGVSGFIVGGITANTNMLKEEPVWSMLSKGGITVGMANVPATFPVMPLIMYPFTGMTGKVAGTFAMPTVIPPFDSIDQTGTSLTTFVLAMIPAPTK